MERRRQQKKGDKGAPKWMVTFSDMMTLILVFFIMLFSMSVVDAQKFRALSESFQQRAIFDFYPSMIPLDDLIEDITDDVGLPDHPIKEEEKGSSPIDDDLNMIDSDEDIKLDKLLAEVLAFLERNNLTDVISALRDERGVVLVLQDRILFDSGEAEILPSAIPFLTKVGLLLENIPNIVKVEGHTDSRSISTYRYPSNWELSGARASSVIRFLIDTYQLDPQRFIATGYGETRPVAPNTTQENLQKNRRVVIVISDPTYYPDDTY
ncbi:flagellar motor protein MotS [Anaerobacillus sp. MEB173]|uniref:flagellar motor protein MotS n=1 Tax=Anaerobacillus sp. MEB173 TaxID=3383345 RepID=UPI003F933B49